MDSVNSYNHLICMCTLFPLACLFWPIFGLLLGLLRCLSKATGGKIGIGDGMYWGY